jgi:nuclear pore complex protein Nup98-Nup96
LIIDASHASANSSVVTRTLVPVFQSAEDAEILSTKLLPLHLAKSPITFDEDRIPCANPSPDLRFATFAELFPTADDSFEASLFRLGHALFDDLDLRLHSSVDAHVEGCVEAVRKKAALSTWLEDAVAPNVDADIKDNPSLSAAAKAYVLLSGHRVEQACDAVLADGNVRLATLISQAGGDARFKEEINAQLQIWRQQRVDVQIDPYIRRIYALLAGLSDVLEGSNGPNGENGSISLAQGLDWKRVFGLHLWYAQPLDATIVDVLDDYNRHWQDFSERTAPPRPWYQVNSSPQPPLWNPPPGAETFDVLFNLIRLYTDENLSLSSVFDPRSFSQSPADYTLPWHLYILLSRCMKYRDFSDRDKPDDEDTDQEVDRNEGPHAEGHSPSADLLTSSYAHQLEQLGLIQEATFVLLHIESSTGHVNILHVFQFLCSYGSSDVKRLSKIFSCDRHQDSTTG